MDEMIQAARSGDLAGVERLLAADADAARAKDADGLSAVLVALYHGHGEVAKRIATAHPSLDAGEAAATRNVDRLRAVLEADPDAAGRRTVDGFTPLHYAAFFGGPEVARVLLDAGADPNIRSENDFSVTPLHSAVAGQSKVALLLIERGAEVNVRQRHGWTPLHGAADHGDEDVVEALLAAGADASATHDGGLDAAQIAEAKGHAAIAARLRQMETSPLRSS
jgi:uncharacterized protein